MKILITGGQGVLGSKLAVELEHRGHDVWTCGRSHGERKHIRADVSEWRQVESLFEQVKPDVCYHLAGEFGRMNGQQYYEQLWKTNCLGTRNVIEACVMQGTRLIFSSSSEAYGSLADKGKLVESDLEHFVPSFHNEYALTKWTNEQQIKTAIKNDGLNATILRFFNVYGPGEFYSDYRSVVCLFIYRAMKHLPITVYVGTHRSFLYVDDWTNAVANVCETSSANGEAFNIGSSEYVDLGTLYDIVVKELGGTKSPLTAINNERSNIADKLPDTSKATELLGLKQAVSLREGVGRTIEWVRAQYV
jgi:dTDP-glucose 4,6-dehydratase